MILLRDLSGVEAQNSRDLVGRQLRKLINRSDALVHMLKSETQRRRGRGALAGRRGSFLV